MSASAPVEAAPDYLPSLVETPPDTIKVIDYGHTLGTQSNGLMPGYLSEDEFVEYYIKALDKLQNKKIILFEDTEDSDLEALKRRLEARGVKNISIHEDNDN